MDSSDLGHGLLVSSGGYGNGPKVSTYGGEFLDLLFEYY